MTDIIAQILDGALIDPDGDGKATLSVPTRSVIIADSLKGGEAEAVASLGLEPPFAVEMPDFTQRERNLEALILHTGHGNIKPVAPRRAFIFVDSPYNFPP